MDKDKELCFFTSDNSASIPKALMRSSLPSMEHRVELSSAETAPLVCVGEAHWHLHRGSIWESLPLSQSRFTFPQMQMMDPPHNFILKTQ